eukprot:4421143-Amphidinium_carterae.1
MTKTSVNKEISAQYHSCAVPFPQNIVRVCIAKAGNGTKPSNYNPWKDDKFRLPRVLCSDKNKGIRAGRGI